MGYIVFMTKLQKKLEQASNFIVRSLLAMVIRIGRAKAESVDVCIHVFMCLKQTGS